MGQQQWLELILLSFVWSICLKQVDGARILLQTPPTITNPWLQFPNILPPMSQPIIPKFNFSFPPISLPQSSPRSPSLPQTQPPNPTIPLLPWNFAVSPPPNSQSFPWNSPSPPLQNNPTFPWLPPSPLPPNAQTFPWTNPTNPIPTIPSFPWNSPSPPLPSSPLFPWSIPSPPPNTPSFPWSIPSPPPLSFPWNNPSSPPPLLNFPWLNASPPPTGISSTLPPFGLPPGSPFFPTGIQFTFSNFTQSWLPEAGVKVTWQSIISVELSLQLFVQALMKPITLIISAIQGTQNGPGSWNWMSGFTDSKLDAHVGALCTTVGNDGFPVKGIVVAQTPIDDTVSTAITWFTILFNGWSKDTPPKATLDHTPGSFGGFVRNSSVGNLKTFCSHPRSLNSIAAKQGQYMLN